MSLTLRERASPFPSLQRQLHGLKLATGVDPRLMVLIGIMVVVWIALDLQTNGIFLSARNLFNLSVQFAVVGIMAAGEITPEEAATVSGVLELRRKAIETENLAERIERLEHGLKSG